MKTLQDLYSEIIASGDEAKRAFVEAVMADGVEDFMRKHDCLATTEEVREFLITKSRETDPVELTADQLNAVAGGLTFSNPCGGPEDTCDSETCIPDCC